MNNIGPEEITKIPFFFYGTLRPGFENYEGILRNKTVSEMPATMKGKMYSVDTETSYPCVIEGNDTIQGELMYIKENLYWDVLKDLDWLEDYQEGDEEGSMYLRRLREVILENGEKAIAWVYIWNKEVREELYVKSGDWKRYIREGKTCSE
ncbi:MAG: gamma-glutamylcyclotransferase family protein [Thermoactinomyces sp.]